MITKIELLKDGSKVVYHQTDGGQKAWTHPFTARKKCEVCRKRK